jgi:hypothetical protein
MSDLPISQLPISLTARTDSQIVVVVDGVTCQMSKNNFLINTPSFSGNTDSLGGSSIRTIYSRTNVITYSVGVESDLFSGSTNFGLRSFPQSFFTNSSGYNNKTIHFRVTGQWSSGGGNDTTATITTKFGNDILSTSINSLLSFSVNKPSEILGEITITNGFAVVCYAVGWCDQTGDYRKLALSDPSTPVDVSGFNGGDFQLLIGSGTTRNFTSYVGYIQVWN